MVEVVEKEVIQGEAVDSGSRTLQIHHFSCFEWTVLKNNRMSTGRATFGRRVPLPASRRTLVIFPDLAKTSPAYVQFNPTSNQ